MTQTQTQKFLTPALALLLVLGPLPRLQAGTTVAFGSTTSATNLTSNGAPLDGRFVFQLGTFTDGFEPTPGNTQAWLTKWQPVTDATGEILAGSTAPYSAEPVGGTFPADLKINAFTGSVVLEHNAPPFDLGGRFFIWGYDQRATPGPAEWILITDPSWRWPDGSSIQPAISFSVAHASTAVIGAINSGGAEMRTATVIVPDESEHHYEGWLARHFPEVLLDDPARQFDVWGEQADPDADGVSNLVEYFTDGDPTRTGSAFGLHSDADGNPIASYSRALEAVGVEGWIECSFNLEDWHRENLTETSFAGQVQARLISQPADRTCFFRLVVRRVP